MVVPTAMKVAGNSTAVRIPILSECVMSLCWMDLSLSAIRLRT